MPRPSEKGTTRNSHIFCLRIPSTLKSEWDAHCDKNGKGQAELLRTVMRYVIKDEMQPELSLISDGPDRGQKERLEVRFTPSEYRTIQERAVAEDISPQRWIINCVRGNLTNEPQFTGEAVKALWDSSYQLRAIGRNLNQIAHRLNEGGYVAAREIEAMVTKLNAAISKHTKKVDQVLDASLSRWRLKR